MRIAIVNDMPMAAEALRRVLMSVPGYRLAWIACDGAEAVEKCKQDTPDLILMDLMMPVMDGIEATRRIMANTPCGILVVTSTLEGHSTEVFEALGAGALDVVQTPVLAGNRQLQGTAALKFKLDAIGHLVSDYRTKQSGSFSGAQTTARFGFRHSLDRYRSLRGRPCGSGVHPERFAARFPGCDCDRSTCGPAICPDNGLLVERAVCAIRACCTARRSASIEYRPHRGNQRPFGFHQCPVARLHHGTAGLSLSSFHRRVFREHRSSLEGRGRGRPPYRYGARRSTGPESDA